MEPVWAQAKALSLTARKKLGLDPDHLVRLLLPCQKDLYSQSCAEAKGSLAEKLDGVYGTTNGASVLMDCTEMVNQKVAVDNILDIMNHQH